MDIISELQQLREDLVREIIQKIERVMENAQNAQLNREEVKQEKKYESIYPLHVSTGIFKGKRPTGIIFADGRRKEVPTWKRVKEEILKDCCKQKHQGSPGKDIGNKPRVAWQ